MSVSMDDMEWAIAGKITKCLWKMCLVTWVWLVQLQPIPFGVFEVHIATPLFLSDLFREFNLARPQLSVGSVNMLNFEGYDECVVQRKREDARSSVSRFSEQLDRCAPPSGSNRAQSTRCS